jgi:hypothetical protein
VPSPPQSVRIEGRHSEIPESIYCQPEVRGTRFGFRICSQALEAVDGIRRAVTNGDGPTLRCCVK